MLLTCGYEDKETHSPLKTPESPSPWCLDTPRLQEWQRTICLSPMSTVQGLMGLLPPRCVWGHHCGSSILHVLAQPEPGPHPSRPVSVLRSLGSREARDAKSCSTEGF